MICRTALTIASLIMLTNPLSGAHASQLTAGEKALVKHSDAHNAEGLALPDRGVNINSGTQNHAGVREVGAIFRAELDSLGFNTQWVNQDEVKRAGHLVADHPGTGPRIRLIVHLDTV